MKVVYCVIFAILLSLNFVAADPIIFKDCGTQGVKINYIDLSNCKSLPCIFQKGQNVTLKISFTSNESFKALKNLVYGQIAGVPVPFPIPQADACVNGVECPVTPGNTYIEELSLPILQAYPSISVIVKFQINNESSKPVICALFPAKIQ